MIASPITSCRSKCCPGLLAIPEFSSVDGLLEPHHLRDGLACLLVNGQTLLEGGSLVLGELAVDVAERIPDQLIGVLVGRMIHSFSYELLSR